MEPSYVGNKITSCIQLHCGVFLYVYMTLIDTHSYTHTLIPTCTHTHSHSNMFLLQTYPLPRASVTSDYVMPMHHTSVESVEDMADLGDLHEASILFNIQQRYLKDLIYVCLLCVCTLCVRIMKMV